VKKFFRGRGIEELHTLKQ
jgi:condensin complex subunit 1